MLKQVVHIVTLGFRAFGWGSKGRMERKLQNEEFCNMYSSPNIIVVK
jgi:hypothetical protein